MAPRYTFGDGPGGTACFRIGDTALPCPGVGLRLNAVIDCSPGEDRMPPVTICFLKNEPQTPQQVAGPFTCDCGDFMLFGQLRRVQEMVAAAGLPVECAPTVNDFLHLSAACAASSFYKSMAITVEAGTPGSIAVEQYEEEDDEEVQAGEAAEECAICYKEYLVGGATSMKLPCGHTFHRRCLDRWTSVRRTCPYCRAPVPDEHDYHDAEDDEEEYLAEHDGGDLAGP